VKQADDDQWRREARTTISIGSFMIWSLSVDSWEMHGVIRKFAIPCGMVYLENYRSPLVIHPTSHICCLHACMEVMLAQQ
jgi:hypothetical protein